MESTNEPSAIVMTHHPSMASMIDSDKWRGSPPAVALLRSLGVFGTDEAIICAAREYCSHPLALYSKDLRGQPPFSIALMTTLLVYSYSVGVFSSRKIAGACERNLAFLAIVGNERPDFRTISDFRKNHTKP